jgi:hypothetical protein
MQVNTDSGNLLEEMRRIFSELFAAANTDHAFLAFEAVGLPIDAGMVKLNPADAAYSQPVAIETISRLANQAPSASGGFLTRGINTIDGTIELCLDGSMPVDADAMSSLGAAKLAAHTRFDLQLGSMSGVPGDQFRPAYASPPDWYVPTVGGNWPTYTTNPQQQATPPTTTTPSAPASTAPPPIWRILAPAAHPQTVTDPGPATAHPFASEHLVAVATPAARQQAHPAIKEAHPAAAFEMHSAAVIDRSPVRQAAEPREPLPGAATPAPTLTPAAPPGAPAAFALQMQRATSWNRGGAALSANTTPQPVSTPGISVSFDHCVVTLDRPWFPDTFLMTRDWFLTGYARGDISAGTGAQDPGTMPLLTRGFVAVCNLKIVANWDATDVAAIQTAAALGPFYLLGSSFDAPSGALTWPGIQIIGWFCSAFPVLPPVADPSLPPRANVPAVPIQAATPTVPLQTADPAAPAQTPAPAAPAQTTDSTVATPAVAAPSTAPAVAAPAVPAPAATDETGNAKGAGGSPPGG